MRRLTDPDLLSAFMRRLADTAGGDGRVYFTGGVTAPVFERIEPDLYRYPAIDPASLRYHVEDALRARI